MILLPALDKSNANETALRFWYSSAFVIDQVPHALFLAAHADAHPVSLISSHLSYTILTTAPFVPLLIFLAFIVLAYANSEVQVRLNTFKGILKVKKAQVKNKNIVSVVLELDLIAVTAPHFTSLDNISQSECIFCGKDLKTINEQRK